MKEQQGRLGLPPAGGHVDGVTVKLSGKWARHRFACSVDYITGTCHGRCCQGTGRIVVSLLPEEAAREAARGHPVRDGLLQPDPATGLCPYKQPDGLCTAHGTPDKPFGCIASPFTLSSGGTLIVRHRYSRLLCHGTGEPAYKVFWPSLVIIFGAGEAARVDRELDAGAADVYATMTPEVYRQLGGLDALKHREV